MRIVIATDFSPCSDAAMRLGVALARRQQALLERDLRRDTQAAVDQKPEQLRLRAAGREAPEALAEEVAALGTDALIVGVPRHRAVRSRDNGAQAMNVTSRSPGRDRE